MTYTNDVTPVCARARDALTVATHLAGIADEIVTMAPLGYTPEPSHDGVSRPVENAAVALDERGVTPRVAAARLKITAAAIQLEDAARELDHAVSAWERSATKP
ncbi:hypothetical protein [Prauserella muralis]|uniref:Uncharacterized protein n=1 Tax=Prauserella muralis TaxID=588067 RepID=A0A2V4ANZ6_9PSEU|nr:hypothetical protein [Prauserella muralis]PXY20856.1 hypothetical protein BAY60_25465 [Prauserella muralis]TWE29893.1 hypothetical protein FHX69_2585 [Prauserella muralis]